MKKAGLIALVALEMLCLGVAHSQEADKQKFRDEATKQDSIYSSQGEKVPTGYVIDRSLSFYAFTLSPDFSGALANLSPTDRWMDIGAGMGQAILDYYTPTYDMQNPDGHARRGSKAQSVAISIEDRRTSLWHQTAAKLDPNKITYHFGKSLNDYTIAELGKFQIITDLLGGFSYTDDISVFMEKTLGFLQTNGSFYTILQDVHAESGLNKPFYANAPFLTEISNADGSKVKVCSWLKSIPASK